jgi:DNA repair exonuclease SbcCD ATPase subunit
MIIKNLQLNNFQLFETVDITFDKVNIITGINHDNPEDASNGAGKSTIVNALLYVLFGDVTGLTQKDLLRFTAKECSLSCELSLNGNDYCIARTIPNSLTIIENGIKLQFNTPSLADKYLQEHLCTKEFFKEFRVIDIKKGLNILDYGNVALKKTMMGFLEDMFNDVRNRLLSKKLDRERFNVDKKPYRYYLSENRLNILEQAYQYYIEEGNRIAHEYQDSNNTISELKAKITSKEYIIRKNEQSAPSPTTKKCPTCGTILNIKAAEAVQKKGDAEIAELKKEIIELQGFVEVGKEDIEYFIEQERVVGQKKIHLYERITRLKEAFKFKDYKYTAKDVTIYAEAIKLLDTFAGVYINEWLKSLEVIINHLLAKVNLSIEFSPDKDFLKVMDNGQVLNYSQLSSGQKTFLSAIFKVAILLQKGLTGIIVADEGMGALDLINLKNLIEIVKDLNFQWVIVYQNINKDFDANFINIERKDGKSTIV